MKKILLSAVVLSLFVTSCKTGAKKDANGNTSVSSSTDANTIIDYTNDIIDVLKKYNDYAEQHTKYYTGLQKKWTGKTTFLPFAGIDNLWTIKKQAANAFGKVPSAMGDDQAFFKDSVGMYNNLFKEFRNQDLVLQLYVKGEDYKDDNYAKGNEIINKQLETYPKLMRLRENIGNRIENIADAAEEITLKDSPIKDAYKNAKSDLASFKKLANMIVSQETFTDVEVANIENNYSKLNESVTKNAAMDKTNLDKENRTTAYNTFYENLNEEIITIKPIIRNLKAEKHISESDFDTIDRVYDNAISYYNSWVK